MLESFEEFEDIWRQAELKACAEDPVRFITNWLWIEEPQEEFNNKGPGWKPFKLWKAQVRIIRELEVAYERSEWRVMFKARGVGGTYTVEGFMFHKWMFKSNFIGLLGSRKEEEVDKAGGKKRSTLFAKLDGFLNHLPEWMLPEGFDRRVHRQHLLLVNPANGAYFVGESANANFGHSNRASMVLLDEYARWKDPVFWSVLGVCACTIAISTLNDNVDAFTDLVDQAEKIGRLITYSVTESENYTPEWLENKRATTDELVFAREYMMDRTASTAGRVYAGFSRFRNVGDFPYDPDLPLAIIWDWGYSDETYMGFLQKDFDSNDLFLVGEICESRQEIGWFLNYYPGVKLMPNPYIIPQKYLTMADKVSGMRRPVKDFGDPSGRNKTQLRESSLFKVLADYGIRPKCNITRWQNMPDRNTAVRNLLDRLHVDESCEWFIRSMEAYKYPERDIYTQSTGSNNNPVHNWASHACTALEAFAITEDQWHDDSVYREMVVRSNTALHVRRG